MAFVECCARSLVRQVFGLRLEKTYATLIHLGQVRQNMP